MEARAFRSPHPVVIAAAIAVIVFCAAGVAAMMGWIPSTIGGVGGHGGEQAEPQSVQSPAPLANRSTAAPAVRPPAAAAPAPTAAAGCIECGVIESVQVVQKPGPTSGVGAAGGAVAGGLLGHQVGGGRGQDVMTIAGAVAGSVAGNHVERKVRAYKSYEITVRMHDGSTRVVSQTTNPAWREGDKVKLIDGRIQPDTA